MTNFKFKNWDEAKTNHNQPDLEPTPTNIFFFLVSMHFPRFYLSFYAFGMRKIIFAFK